MNTSRAIVGLGIALWLAACVEPAIAQQPAPDGGVRLITLGTTAGPLPRKDRAQSSNLVIVRGVPYLIDAGDGVARRIVQAGVDFTRIGTIFITHPHNDHTGGLANLLNVAWQYARQKPIEVIGPPGTEETVQGALAFNRVDEEIRLSENRDKPLASIVKARNVAAGKIYRDDNITVSAIENSHFQFPPNSPAFGKYKSYGYRIETPTASIVFTGDTGPSEELKALARGADILVSEALAIDEVRSRLQRAGQWQKMSESEHTGWEMHMSAEHITPEMAGEIAEAAGVKTLVLSHLSASGTDNDDYARFVQAAAKHFHGRLIVAKDLLEISP